MAQPRLCERDVGQVVVERNRRAHMPKQERKPESVRVSRSCKRPMVCMAVVVVCVLSEEVGD